MSSGLYDKFARINRIDQAIYESEQEIANGAGSNGDTALLPAFNCFSQEVVSIGTKISKGENNS